MYYREKRAHSRCTACMRFVSMYTAVNNAPLAPPVLNCCSDRPVLLQTPGCGRAGMMKATKPVKAQSAASTGSVLTDTA